MEDESGKENHLNSYERKQADRKARYEELGNKAGAQAETTLTRARQMAEAIPFGQPILVGHHSEKRDRNYRKRIDNTFRRAFDEDGKAKHYRQKAAAVGSGGISSDDPDAIEKLKAKLEELQANQATMKAANRIIRSKKSEPDKVAALMELGYSKAHRALLLEPDELGNLGFAGYELSNNNANIRRIKERIAQLDCAQTESIESDRGGYVLRENADINRMQLVFPGKPNDEIRTKLKSLGFRWSPTEGAWQRHLNNGARGAAEQFDRWMKTRNSA